jgi:hypothetical protein
MAQDRQANQQKINQGYADFLVKYETAKAQGRVLGGFTEWQHATGRVEIRIQGRDMR